MWALISILHPSSQSNSEQPCEVSLVTLAMGDTLSPSLHPSWHPVTQSPSSRRAVTDKTEREP